MPASLGTAADLSGALPNLGDDPQVVGVADLGAGASKDQFIGFLGGLRGDCLRGKRLVGPGMKALLTRFTRAPSPSFAALCRLQL